MQVVDGAPVLGVVMLLGVDHGRGGAHGQGGADRAHRQARKGELAVNVNITYRLRLSKTSL